MADHLEPGEGPEDGARPECGDAAPVVPLHPANGRVPPPPDDAPIEEQERWWHEQEEPRLARHFPAVAADPEEAERRLLEPANGTVVKGEMLRQAYAAGMAAGMAEQARREANERRQTVLPPRNGDGPKPPAVPPGTPLTPAAWVARQLAPPDAIMGDLFSTTSRVLFSADTGLGKSMFALGLALAMHVGRDFLHWSSRRRARVLVLDGEMPADLLQARICIACEWFGVPPAEITEGLFILSREDVENMTPLDSPAGHDWLLAVIDELGGVDFVVFDNVMSLTTGDLREETTWRELVPLSRNLSKMKVGQLWLHHTGHDKTRAYGSRLFSWQMDAVGNGEAVVDASADVSFKLTWQKARRRTPDNRADFEAVNVRLGDGIWTGQPDTSGQSVPSGPVRLNHAGTLAVKALAKALDAAGERPPGHPELRGVERTVSLSLWRRYFGQIAGYGADERGQDAERKAFSRGKENALGVGRAKVWGDLAWTA